MKNTLKIILILGVFILISFSCEKSENNCSLTSFTPVDFSKYPSVTVVDNVIEDKFLIINSKDDFAKNIFIQGASNGAIDIANIDYKQYTLLIGKKRLTGLQGTLINQSFEKKCGISKYTYTAIIQNGGYTAVGIFFYGIIIPKQNSTDIQVNVEVIK